MYCSADKYASFSQPSSLFVPSPRAVIRVSALPPQPDRVNTFICTVSEPIEATPLGRDQNTMGNICGSPIGTLLARIEECLLPDDRDPLLDIMEEIQGRVSSIIGKKGASQNFVLAKGVPCILKVMRTMIQDDVVLRLGVAIFDYQKDNRLCMVQFITNGGLTVLEDTLTHHPMDTTLSALIPVLQKYVRGMCAPILAVYGV